MAESDGSGASCPAVPETPLRRLESHRASIGSCNAAAYRVRTRVDHPLGVHACEAEPVIAVRRCSNQMAARLARRLPRGSPGSTLPLKGSGRYEQVDTTHEIAFRRRHVRDRFHGRASRVGPVATMYLPPGHTGLPPILHFSPGRRALHPGRFPALYLPPGHARLPAILHLSSGRRALHPGRFPALYLPPGHARLPAILHLSPGRRALHALSQRAPPAR